MITGSIFTVILKFRHIISDFVSPEIIWKLVFSKVISCEHKLSPKEELFPLPSGVCSGRLFSSRGLLLGLFLITDYSYTPLILVKYTHGGNS